MKATVPQSWIKILNVFVILMACLNHYSRERCWLPIIGSESHPVLAVGGQAFPPDSSGCQRRGGTTVGVEGEGEQELSTWALHFTVYVLETIVFLNSGLISYSGILY